MHAKKKIEIFIEAPASRLVMDVLERHGARGYTALTASSGRGSGGTWDVSPVTDARQQVMIVTVVAPDRVTPIVDDVGVLFADYHGVLFVSDVSVLRSERF